MTCIISIKNKETNKYWMACDSLVMNSKYNIYDYNILAHSKIINFNNKILVAITGDAIFQQYLLLYSKSNEMKDIMVEEGTEFEYILNKFIPGFFNYLNNFPLPIEKIDSDKKLITSKFMILLNNKVFTYGGTSKQLRYFDSDCEIIGYGSNAKYAYYVIEKYNSNIPTLDKIKTLFESVEKYTTSVKGPYYVFIPNKDSQYEQVKID